MASPRHAVHTLADVVLASILSVRDTLGRIPGLPVDHIEDGEWRHLAVEYGVLHLYLLTEHAHQVLEERAAQSVVGEIADRLSHALAQKMATSRNEQRQMIQWFGDTIKDRFDSYRKQPMVVDPESGDVVEVAHFDRVRGTVFGSFVEQLVPRVASGSEEVLAPAIVMDLWLDTLSRSEGWYRVYAPLLDLVAAQATGEPESPGAEGKSQD